MSRGIRRIFENCKEYWKGKKNEFYGRDKEAAEKGDAGAGREDILVYQGISGGMCGTKMTEGKRGLAAGAVSPLFCFGRKAGSLWIPEAPTLPG